MTRSSFRRVRWWRSPADQPWWSRPLLLLAMLAGGLLYGIDAAGNLEIFYAAAVRSMSTSWHNFFFASFDPAGTITVDKLPGAFWVQAVAARVFGVHPWVLVAPQVVEGMLSILVIHRIVHRLSGPLASIVAAGVLAVYPATAYLNRGNISDTLMVLLLLLAADAVVSAAMTGRTVMLLVAGGWAGLAFQAKMIEAWLVLPALACAYLIGAAEPMTRKLVRLLASGAVTAAVSLSWMVLVTLWPASRRPYVDGSSSNSVFSQVFVYNGFGRVDQATPNQLLSRAIGLRLPSSSPSWNRLLSGPNGRDVAWLLPVVAVSLVVGACTSRGADERHRRIAVSLWGTWLVVLFVVFSAGSTINTYYLGALSPAIAGLLGIGVAMAWERRADRRAGVLLASTVAVSGVYVGWLVPSHGVGASVLLVVVTAVAAGLALAGLLIWRVGPATLAAALGAVMVVPLIASITAPVKGLGPFDSPFESDRAFAATRVLGGVADQTRPLDANLEQGSRSSQWLMATQTSAVAAAFIFNTGREVLPIGGYSGSTPSPTLAQIQSDIQAGKFHLVIQAPRVTDPRLLWLAAHCITISTGTGTGTGGTRGTGLVFAVYYCVPASVGAAAGGPGPVTSPAGSGT